MPLKSNPDWRDCGCFELPVDAQKPAPLKTWICREDGTPAGEGREFIILDIKRREYLLKNGRWRVKPADLEAFIKMRQNY
ncbi:MAG: hypothetical protein HGA87_02260 [Desulfobulbaceae bacterium]|nr:hypothetical protein [Desulfobulbaceae bacterium]